MTPSAEAGRGVIVCADDDAVIRAALVAAFADSGYTLVTYADGNQVLEALKTSRPALVLLDLRLPPVDGFEVLRRLRQLRGHRHTPVAFLSASTAQDDVVLGLNLGAIDYFAKPIIPGLLRAKVEFLLARQAERLPAMSADLDGAPAEVQWAAEDPDRLLDKYVLVEEIGGGATGHVLKAWDTSLGIYVALKFLRGIVSPQQVKTFYREARTVARLHHEHICRIYDIRQADGQHFIAMQLVEGSPPALKLPPDEAAGIVSRIARAVHHAHEQGVLHRDIKPDNIAIDLAGKPWILDFGIATSIERAVLARERSIVGSPGYMAPEQAGCSNMPVSPLSDVYGLGATLYHFITGQPPVEGRTTTEALAVLEMGEIVPPSKLVPNLDPELERICLKAMARDPRDRHKSALALSEALDAHLAPRAAPRLRLGRWSWPSR